MGCLRLSGESSLPGFAPTLTHECRTTSPRARTDESEKIYLEAWRQRQVGALCSLNAKAQQRFDSDSGVRREQLMTPP